MNSDAGIKQFHLIKFINENSGDEHVISKISIVLRRDKIEAPYYMDSKIRMSSCVDRQENGLVHAMDLLNHNRMHNLSEEKYRKIESLILDAFDEDDESAKIFREEKRLKIVLTSKSSEEFANIAKDYRELFDVIDSLVD